jgi:hypothetical protein
MKLWHGSNFTFSLQHGRRKKPKRQLSGVAERRRLGDETVPGEVLLWRTDYAFLSRRRPC